MVQVGQAKGGWAPALYIDNHKKPNPSHHTSILIMAKRSPFIHLRKPSETKEHSMCVSKTQNSLLKLTHVEPENGTPAFGFSSDPMPSEELTEDRSSEDKWPA